MIKDFKMKEVKDPEEYCFLCSKVGVDFDIVSLKFIQELTLCMHHTETTKEILTPREPGQEG